MSIKVLFTALSLILCSSSIQMRLVASEPASDFSSVKFAFGDEMTLFTHPNQDIKLKLHKTLPSSLKLKADIYMPAVVYLSAKYQVDPIWVISIIWTESSFTPYAQSRAGAYGLMQIMPETKTYLKKLIANKGQRLEKSSPKFWTKFYGKLSTAKIKKIEHDIENLELGIFYLRTLLDRFESHHLATVAYNMGPSWTRRMLLNNQPVGVKNHYLKKVKTAYQHIKERI